jgi:hypothetical protein
MAKVFVSHASADKEFVDLFVDYVLRIGLGLNGDKVFYSSERDTGVPSGADLMAHLRTEVSEATLVITVVTPMYQSRPVCIAELGAAWGRTSPEHFFPLLAPNLSRTELEGVLPSALTLRIDDAAALDELSDRAEEALGSQVTKTQWGVGKQKWLSVVGSVATSLQQPEIPTIDEYKTAVRELAELREALDYTEREVDEWKQKFELVAEAKDQAEVTRIRVGDKPIDVFQNALTAARNTVGKLPSCVREAIFQSLRGEGIYGPNRFDDPDSSDAFEDAIERKLLVENHENEYVPNPEKSRVGEALEAVEHLEEAMDPAKTGPEFDDWFRSEYGGNAPDLRDRDCWEELMN